MPEPSVPPPLRVRNPSGTFSQIPVFELQISGGTLTKLSPIRAQLLIDSGGGSGAPTTAPYVVYSANATLSASKILTAGSSVTLVTDATAIYVNALTGGGGTTVYAATGNQYVTLVDAADLTADRVLAASTGLQLRDMGANANVFMSIGSLVVTTSRAINTTAPLAGGGDLSADRTLTADTAALVTSGRTITAVFPVSGGGDLSVNRSLYVNTAFLVTSSRNVNTTAPLAGGGNLGADLTLTADTAALVTSGRTLTAVFPISGGGDLSANRSLYVSTGGFLVLSSRAINTTAPLAGGGDLSVDRTHTIDTAAMVTSGRSISTLFPISGGGDLSANRTFAVDTAFLVTSTRAINTTAPLAGGGNLSADRTFTADTAVLVTSGRSISTLFPLSGGGDLSANRTFATDTAFLVTSTRTISVAGGALSGGGNLSADRTITLGTPIAVGSGGTGQVTLTQFGILYGSGASAIQATSGLNAGMLAVGSGLNQNLALIGSGTTGQMFVSTGGIVGNVAWINTAAAGGSGTVNAGSSQNVAIYNANGTVVDDVTPMGSGGTILGANTGATAHVYIALSAGNNVTITHTDSAMVIAATTGGPGTGTVNTGSDTALAFYPTAGTAVSGATITMTTGGGFAPLNVAILTSGAASPVSGDVWWLASNNRIYLMVYSNALTFSVELTN